ncbi:MAG: CCA tRNA nucleotidyltransferase [Phycisphaerae bacterium]
MSEARISFQFSLPREADAALDVLMRLRETDHEAFFAGGCVRDLLLGNPPKDFDVATSAHPPDVMRLFRSTRKVGAQFGVVLVSSRGDWIEVATFRTDGKYEDGRRPADVTFTNAREDALRRDFTINGMFLDPVDRVVVDYVDGRADLEGGVIRAIGDPKARFEEDYLRLLRAVRFAARLSFAIENHTLAAIRANAAKISQVARERVLIELEAMLAHPNRARAFDLLVETGMLPHLWPGTHFTTAEIAEAGVLLRALPPEASFVAAFACLVKTLDKKRISQIARALTFSNEQRDALVWVCANRDLLHEPEQVMLADLKRALAHPAFAALRELATAQFAQLADGAARSAALDARIRAIPEDQIQPFPFISGEDLIARGLTPGPLFKDVLHELYTRQLNEELTDREAALRALAELLREKGVE